MIVEKITAAKDKKRSIMPVNANRASDLGNPCIRYHVLNRTRWQEKTLPDVGLQFIFDLGNEVEKIVFRWLDEAGITALEQQRAFQWADYQITGHIDGKVLIDGYAAPLAIKSMSPHIWAQINTAADMVNSKFPYLKKYPVQLNLYLLMDSKEYGYFLLFNKSPGQIKEIRFDLDYQLGEETIKRAECINAHLAAGTIPTHEECADHCDDRCPFMHICLPDHVGTAPTIFDSDEIETMIDRMNELKAAVKEYSEIDAELKSKLAGIEKGIAGKYLITGQWVEKKAFSVAANRYWKRIIKAVGQ